LLIQSPAAISVLVSYLGAGLFYTAADIVSVGWPKELPWPYRPFTLAIGAVTWLFVCLLATAMHGRLLGWRAGASYLVTDGVPAITLFLGGVIFASMIT
jgi:hypothetical protein